ncbi:hypothetical protein ACOSQ3_018698 [Xanthoceras sorbifolium]
MIENYCYGDDGYSMQQESYHAMQNEYNNNNHHSSMQMMKPSSQYSKQNMMMHGESYGSHHQDGFHSKNKYQNGVGCHNNMYQNGYSGSASNGFYMSHTAMGSKPTSHHGMNASHLSHGGAGGYNTMMMSSTEYDNYNKVRPGPMRMQTAGAMGYGGYQYNQSVNCMPSNGHHSSEWISKGLDNE